MQRTILTAILLFGFASTVRPTPQVYDSLTRETLVGTWEGVAGIGSVPIVVHIVIAPRNDDSYLVEVYPDYMGATAFRLQSCTVVDGLVKLHFRAIPANDGRSFWIEGEGHVSEQKSFIQARLAIDIKDTHPPFDPKVPAGFYLEKSTWVRRLGEASTRASEEVARIQREKK
ncbi:MAG: hypothetical protein M3Y27_23185 [Acidobacteriota bacterium]|nr:hypothetical protein [Acidobacteriota bacterium]